MLFSAATAEIFPGFFEKISVSSNFRMKKEKMIIKNRFIRDQMREVLEIDSECSKY
jgi:hypothetical protein